MYALVEILGKQYKAVEGEKILVDHLNLEAGSSYETEKVLANASQATANRLIDFFIFYMVFNWLTKFVKNAFIHTKQLQKNNFGAEN